MQEDPAYEACTYCGYEFPIPVELHHGEQECSENQ